MEVVGVDRRCPEQDMTVKPDVALREEVPLEQIYTEEIVPSFGDPFEDEVPMDP